MVETRLPFLFCFILAFSLFLYMNKRMLTLLLAKMVSHLDTSCFFDYRLKRRSRTFWISLVIPMVYLDLHLSWSCQRYGTLP